MPRPFGRSLDPLPEEDIGGYLLRLSAHLCMPPGNLLTATGLPKRGGSQIVRHLLLHSDLDQFAELTRLAPAEARALTLNEWKDRYQPIETALTLGDPRGFAIRGAHNWLYARSTRHCPTCLAGDGSKIQNKYGGAWKRIWRLPITFACVEHRVFLSEGCGAKHAELSGGLLLIPSAAVSELHPAQCRLLRPGESGRGSRLCGNRLDHPAAEQTVRPAQRYLDIQQQMIDYLGPSIAPRRARNTFADIRLVSAFLNRLPHERWSAIDSAVHDAIGDTIGMYNELSPALDEPPRGVVSTATMLTAAAEILGDPQRQAELLRLIYTETKYPVALRKLEKAWARSAIGCTPAVHENFVAALTALRASHGREAHARAALNPAHGHTAAVTSTARL